jgi:putative transposase
MGLAYERIDGLELLHHIMARRIERSKISRDNTGRNDFLNRLGGIIKKTDTVCFGWAIMRNVAGLDSRLVGFCTLTS